MKDRRQSNRRKHPRVEFDWPVIILSEEITISGKLKDISRGGALVLVEADLDLGSIISMAIEIPEFEDVISVKGEIVRAVSLLDEAETSLFALGVRFTEISPADLRYFTGNLAPEWQEGYREPERREVKSGFKFITISAGVIILFLVLALSYSLFPDKKPRSNIDELASIGKQADQTQENVTQTIPDQEYVKLLKQHIQLLEDKIIRLEEKVINDEYTQTQDVASLQVAGEKEKLVPELGKEKSSLRISTLQTVIDDHFVLP